MVSIFLQCALEVLVMTAIVFAIGRALHKAIGKGSEGRRIHGRYVLIWATAGYFLGDCVRLTMLRPDNFQAFSQAFGGGLAGFGMLLGLLIGSIHGAIVLLFRKGANAPNEHVEPTAASDGIGR